MLFHLTISRLLIWAPKILCLMSFFCFIYFQFAVVGRLRNLNIWVRDHLPLTFTVPSGTVSRPWFIIRFYAQNFEEGEGGILVWACLCVCLPITLCMRSRTIRDRISEIQYIECAWKIRGNGFLFSFLSDLSLQSLLPFFRTDGTLYKITGESFS